MKRLFMIVAFCLLASQTWAVGVYNNSGTEGADSITIPFYALDSAGNMVDLASGDSIFVQFHYPEGAMAFEDSGSYDGTGLDGSLVSNDFSGQTMYYYSDAVADIDGTAEQGVYTYAIFVKDLTSAAITTPHYGTFQLVTETDFHTTLEYIKDALDSLQAQDGWIAKEATVQIIDDTIDLYDGRWDENAAILDTLQNHDDWVAKEATVAEVPDIADSLELYDTRWDENAAILDTLQNQDNWVAKEAGEIGMVLDTLQLWDTRIDSIEAALADASISDKVWADGTPANRAEINDILDTLQNQDNWGATSANQTLIIDTVNGIIDTIQDGADGIHVGVIVMGGDVITAASIATDAIGALEIADNAIDAGAIAANAIGASEVADNAIDAGAIAANAITASEIATGAIAADEIAADAIGSSELATTAANEIADEVWDEDTASHNTAASYGIFFKDTLVFQGDAASVTLAGIWDTVAQIFQDSLASIDDVWRNRDTANVDSSDIGEWFVNNLAGIATISDADMAAIADTILDAAISDHAVAGSFADFLFDSINSIIDSNNNLATTDEVWYNIDTTNIDTSALGTWMQAYLTAAGQWTTVKVDSMMDGLFRSDSIIHQYVWGDSSHKVAVASDTLVSGGYLPITKINYGDNLVHNGGFEVDSVNGTTEPSFWFFDLTASNANNSIVTSGIEGRWDYRLISAGTSPQACWQEVGYLYPGVYTMSGVMRRVNADSVGIVFDSGTTFTVASGYHDSIYTNNSVVRSYSKDVTVLSPGYYMIGCVLFSSSADKYGDFDDIKFIYKAPLTMIASDTMLDGNTISTLTAAQAADGVWDEDTTGHNTAKSYSVLVKDTLSQQGAASGLTVAQIQAGIFGQTMDTAFAAGTFGDSAKIFGGGGGSDTTAIKAMHNNNTFTTITKSMLDSVVAKIEDTIIANAASYKATGFSTFDETADNVTIATTNASGEIVAVMPSSWTVNDTSAYQGSAGSGSDTTAIKAMGTNNPDIFYGPSATGSGTYTCTLTVIDSTDWQNGTGTALSSVPYVQLSFFGSDQTASPLVIARTDAQGNLVLSADAGYHVITSALPGYTFPGDSASRGYDSANVAGAQRDTIWCYHANTNMTSVWGNVKNFVAGNLEDVEVTFALTKRNMLRDSDSGWVAPVEYSTKTDASGNFSLSVYASTGLYLYGGSASTDSVGYKVSFRYSGGEWGPRSKVYVPNQTSWQFLKVE